MTALVGVSEQGHRRIRRAAFAGHLVEWYEFSIYGVLSAYLASAIFPDQDPAAALALTWATFSIAFLVRPVGGVVLARFSDRRGRRSALLVTIVIMSAATVGIGLVPNFAAIGVLAPVLFVALRMAQGFAVGGEMPSAVPYFGETVRGGARPARSLSVLATGPWVAALAGALLAGVIARFVSPEQMVAWGWRIPFLLALPLGIVAIALRVVAPESDASQAVRQRGPSARPLREALRIAPRAMVWLAAVSLAFNVTIAMCLGGLTSEALLAGLPNEGSIWVSAAAYVAFIAFILAAGRALADVPPARVVRWGAVALAVLALPAIALARTGVLAAVIGGVVLLAIPVALFANPVYVAMSRAFPARVRASAGGLAFNLATAVSSLVATTTLAARNVLGFEYGLVVWAAIGVVGVVAVRRIDIQETRDVDG
ncbi:MFS transporter [Microbacterium excoecariae]|uniref:MFS transporter n=1 Tax=Microbacterium excoecariae TaxID=2715210 RepID=UPI00140A6A44|nr:MFS transporter [Microbacterium excoecariae]NHI17978.1 MHS family MFS transporter [Microbacterium excoecariae]